MCERVPYDLFAGNALIDSDVMRADKRFLATHLDERVRLILAGHERRQYEGGT